MSVRRVMVLGSGGREHALAWRLGGDREAPEVIVAPGNAGLATRLPCVPVDPCDAGAVVELALARDVDLVVIGPETPLALGVADALAAAGVPAFGPSRDAAGLESSKWFAKTVLAESGVPTARAVRCDSTTAARAALDGFAPPWVLKADGLAAGKGVRVTADREEAHGFLEACLGGGAFGAGGRVVVIEEYLAGEEASVLAVTDGERFVLLPAARDFKRALEHDLGPNTGGMGAWAPHPAVSGVLEAEIAERVIAPVLRRMRERGTPYRGTLYAGLMLTDEGPKVIEFNARFGDPEAQAVLPLVSGSLAECLAGVARGALDPGTVGRRPGAAVAVALTSSAYPAEAATAGRIEGLEACEGCEGILVFHAATAPEGGGHRITGGRAAYVVATADTPATAATRIRAAMASLGGQGWRHRADVARWGADAGSAEIGTDSGAGSAPGPGSRAAFNRGG